MKRYLLTLTIGFQSILFGQMDSTNHFVELHYTGLKYDNPLYSGAGATVNRQISERVSIEASYDLIAIKEIDDYPGYVKKTFSGSLQQIHFRVGLGKTWTNTSFHFLAGAGTRRTSKVHVDQDWANEPDVNLTYSSRTTITFQIGFRFGAQLNERFSIQATGLASFGPALYDATNPHNNDDDYHIVNQQGLLVANIGLTYHFLAR